MILKYNRVSFGFSPRVTRCPKVIDTRVLCSGSRPPSMRKNRDNPGDRLSKVLASAGVASRRHAEELIFAGKVQVNGVVVEKPETRVARTKDEVKVDGKLIDVRKPELHYFALNKPKDVFCTSDKDAPEVQGKPIVLDLFDDWMSKWQKRMSTKGRPGMDKHLPRLFTVGRLDAKSWGLIFVTNDGKWAQKIAHPSSGITKEYVVRAKSKPEKWHEEALAAGTVVEGRLVVPVSVMIEGDFYRVVIAEGRKREVRELFSAKGLTVKSLKRVRIGGYRMPQNMKVGEFRALTARDLRRVEDKNLQKSV